MVMSLTHTHIIRVMFTSKMFCSTLNKDTIANLLFWLNFDAQLDIFI